MAGTLCVCGSYLCHTCGTSPVPSDSSRARTPLVDGGYSPGPGQEVEKGLKFDQGKLEYALIPPYPLRQLTQVYTDGAVKYGRDNYLNGLAFRRVLAALMRHVEAFRAGEDTDPESGSPHMAHAAWQCFTLMEYMHQGIGEDDRIVDIGGNNAKTEAQ